MKTFKYDEKYGSIICDHEKTMYQKHCDVMELYDDKFRSLGFKLANAIFWYNSLNDLVSTERLPFKNGYRCDFTVGVEKEGENINYYEENDVTLGANFNISSISRYLFHLNVVLCTDLSDVISEMDCLLESAAKL